mmetsp:Transcript_35611/g.81608  ORF Transcript_35611/g.81608 Transcript_35611/m.81608 type:complete len:354 (-) Transcript_35611:36-1097(-)
MPLMLPVATEVGMPTYIKGAQAQPVDDDFAGECIICLEQTQKSVGLPCNCNAAYCLGCWDRALAQSLSSCGQARCPTCRAAVRVDFDAETGNLLFSRDSDDAPVNHDEEEAGEAETVQPFDRREALRRRTLEARSKLVEQARPAQVRLLRELRNTFRRDGVDSYACYTRERSADDQPVNWTDTCPQTPSLGDLMRFGNQLADLDSVSLLSPPLVRPPCVCGGHLERVPHRERARRWLRRLGYQNLEHVVEMVTTKGVSTCTCDLCGEPVDPSGYVWTCEKANRAILHTNDWDVCDACFDLYTSEPGSTTGSLALSGQCQDARMDPERLLCESTEDVHRISISFGDAPDQALPT